MRGTERKLLIMKYLQENGHMDSTELAKMFDVSTMTIRRDLAKLEEEGLVTLEYGSVILNDGVTFEHNMTMKQSEHQEEKRRIAKQCASYIKDGDAIYLDSGTTVYELAKLIANRKNITVMSHSLLVANALATTSVNFIMCPGQYRPKSMAYMGQLTDQFVSLFRFDKMFLATEGIDEQMGVSTQNITDGATKNAVIDRAKWICCMADSSKFDKQLYYNTGIWSKIDVLVTDSRLDEETVKRYKKKVELVIV